MPTAQPAKTQPRTTKRRLVWGLALVLTGVPVLWFGLSWLTYPSDKTPEGAYLRVMSAVNRDAPEDFFAYIEEQAQHACFTIRDYRKKARARVLQAYPEPERSRLAAEYRAFAMAEDGSDVFALYAHEHGWLDHLRHDMSGVRHVQVVGERASVQTVRGTRYPFRRRPNGIWGLTLYTATLVSQAEKAARDYKMIEQAASDYERVR